MKPARVDAGTATAILRAMLIHVRHFGAAYLPATERLARAIGHNQW